MIVSLTGGTVGNVSGNVIETSATTGTTTITTDVNLTSTGGNGIRRVDDDGHDQHQRKRRHQRPDQRRPRAGIRRRQRQCHQWRSHHRRHRPGVFATSSGGNVLVATGSTVSGGTIGIMAGTIGSGTVTVTTGGAVTGTSQQGIFTDAQ